MGTESIPDEGKACATMDTNPPSHKLFLFTKENDHGSTVTIFSSTCLP